MNANELAEILEDVGMEQKHYDTIQKVATMLRQQQAEIEALKKDNKELHAIAQGMAMAESDARKSLQWFKDAKERQSEPVAWMSVELNGRTVLATYEFETAIPLYTHPAKTLTEDTECQYCKQGCIRCDARKTLTDEEIIEIWSGMETDTGEQNIIFARAILRKAQND